MDRTLIKDFWNCGDNDIIEFALLKARLNKREKEVIHLILDECLTQEQAAERLDYSPRRLQEFWYSGCDKLLNINWVRAYAIFIRKSNNQTCKI